MYILSGIFIVLCVIFFFLNYRRRRKIICRVRDMECCRKINILNELIRPLGFFYDECADAFFTRTDAWQHEFGYRALFDRTAPRFHMVFDCEPVYFDYDERTWLIEFWKGQYGINTGGEVGVYCADGFLAPEQYPYAQFHGVPESRMLPMSIELKRRGKLLLDAQKLHWWLAGFRLGEFSRPGELTMDISLTFPDDSMMYSFVDSLRKMGYGDCDLCLCGHTVSLTFSVPHTKRRGFWQGLRSKLAQWENDLFVRLFRWATHPFSCTADRLLYLYYFIPSAFRHTVGIRRSCGKRKGCCAPLGDMNTRGGRL